MLRKILFILLLADLLYSPSTIIAQKQDKPVIARKPYLQSAIADSLTILWRTNEGSSCSVAYKLKSSTEWKYQKGQIRKTNTGFIENEVVLHELSPSTTYEYKIFTDNLSLAESETYYFKAPLASNTKSFSFFAVGDIGEPIEEGGTPDKLAKALAPYKDSVNFGLLLGDIIYPDGRSKDYDVNLFDHFGGVFPYVPVFTVLGNHDWHKPENNYMKEWKLPGNEHYYSFDKGSAHFIALDTKNGEMYDYKEQLEWLKQDLQKIPDTTQWRIVFLHHNGKSCTYKNDYEAVMSLYPLFEKYNVDLVLNGHAHTYERLNPMDGKGNVKSSSNSIKYSSPKGFVSITVGSGGKLRGVGTDPTPFSPDPENCEYKGLVAAYAHKWAFLFLTIDGNQLRAEAISTENHKVLDSFSIEK
ncbi:hypothetical protein C9994_02900 [Marivirga lumbricoides]|uniref:Calcineurin-like phosphoesterase domain-containing protein n=1 Tax=Marivirga lumbricoides TaxID=1046115 RepID=A0A2T4DUA1_9BACT|nr:hypothetical protein C9994_02900 [Marivirga lumbricoides]